MSYTKPNKKLIAKKKSPIEKVILELKKIPEIKSIYLFGSYAKGIEKPISDIDICVITTKNISKSKKEEILSYSGNLIDISIFWYLPITMKSKIFREGKLLFCRDEDFLSEVISDTMREYLDFKGSIERFTNTYLEV